MKWVHDNGPGDAFLDQVTHLIDEAPDDLTLAEMIGILELQLHVLKNRMTLPPPKQPEPYDV